MKLRAARGGRGAEISYPSISERQSAKGKQLMFNVDLSKWDIKV